MYPSLALCRRQEVIQRARAAEASLTNVRLVAEAAAAAWQSEALYAEKRERREEKRLELRAASAGGTPVTTAEDDGWFSENPDRGLADTRRAH